MNAWRNTVKIYDSEDEQALIGEFVKFSALYKHYSIFEIGQHVFRDLPDGFSRGQQAGSIWGNSIEIQERIRLYVPPHTGESNRDYIIRQAKLIIEDERTDPKDRNSALVILGRMEGEFKKEVEVVDPTAKAGGLPVFLYEAVDYNKDPPADGV